ncbi:MAG: hypothetical protein ABRQ38_29095 [Candidatus Eremiobacterota bacterium]
MRKINFDEFIKEKKKNYFSLRARLGRKRMAVRRQRDPEERDLLMIMDRNRLNKWIEQGEIQMISIRHFSVKL